MRQLGLILPLGEDMHGALHVIVLTVMCVCIAFMPAVWGASMYVDRSPPPVCCAYCALRIQEIEQLASY